jgi:hypothetical protein
MVLVFMGSVQRKKKSYFLWDPSVGPTLDIGGWNQEDQANHEFECASQTNWLMSCNDLEKENIMFWPTTPKPQVNEIVVVVGCVENGQTNNLRKP